MTFDEEEQTVAPNNLEGDFETENLRYTSDERAASTGAPLSGDLDAPHLYDPNRE